MEFVNGTLNDLLVIHDKKRKPLSKLERSKHKGDFPYYGATGIIDYVDNYLFDGLYILLGEDGTVQTAEGRPILQLADGKFWVSNHAHVITNSSKIDFKFLYYLLSNTDIKSIITGAVQPKISQSNLLSLKVKYPLLKKDQLKIAKILFDIDNLIHDNLKLCNTLELYLANVFQSMFRDKIYPTAGDKNDKFIPLKDLIDVIDNRGKTPPMTEDDFRFPIIDVRALSGDSRIIDYKNCTKYVSEDTYKNWFRNGHPKKFDILISTVGSLAEMKMFFNNNNGVIAQNVVSLRTKSISPFYLFQYLKFIKKDLLAFDIGSVQPSIKITHINKHPIYIPDEKSLLEFHNIGKSISILINSKIKLCVQLSQLKEKILPDLMEGKINVDNIKKEG